MINIKELSIDELLELAKQSAEEKKEVKIQPHVQDFIKDYQIYPGTALIPTYVIFHEYRRIWRHESRMKLSKVHFFIEFNNLFEQKRTTKTRYYLLNEGSFNLSKEYLTETKKLDKQYEKRVRSKKENMAEPDKTE